MTTISSVELRKNLEAILKRVQNGEEIVLTYRDKAVARLTPEAKPKKRMEGLDALNAAPRKDSGLDPRKSVKELYHEHLEGKYGKYAD